MEFTTTFCTLEMVGTSSSLFSMERLTIGAQGEEEGSHWCLRSPPQGLSISLRRAALWFKADNSGKSDRQKEVFRVPREAGVSSIEERYLTHCVSV